MVLGKCGTDTGDIEEEIHAIQNSLGSQARSLGEDSFFSRRYRKPILLVAAIVMFNQLSGINALIYYTKHIFEMAGYGSADALQQSIVIGLVNLVFTVVAMTVIDHMGRKPLILIGSLGYILSLSMVSYAFYSAASGKLLLAGLILFIASHAIGQGSICFVFISEIFPNRVRARGQAFGSFVLWVTAAAVSWSFPVFSAASGWMTFAVFGLCCVCQLIWVIVAMPETKNVSLESIQKQLHIE